MVDLDQQSQTLTTQIGAVIIGRNEGQRLAECLKSVHDQTLRLVYVDSGSTDGSAIEAKSNGYDAIILEQGPYTAARGRQTGFDFLLEKYPDITYVFFIDGDCLLEEKFIIAASKYLDNNPNTAAVCGRRKEQRCDQSFYSRLIDIDWAIPPGEVPYFGGESLIRVNILKQAGGWDVNLIAGEEPDLCFRLRQQGHTIWRLPDPMTKHDIAMTSFTQYFRRSIRSGYAYAQVGYRHRNENSKPWLKMSLSTLAYGLALPIVFTVTLIFMSTLWPATILLSLVYLRLIFSMTRYVSKRGYPFGLSLAYTIANIICKTAGAWGVLRYIIHHLTQKQATIIEYKQPDA